MLKSACLRLRQSLVHPGLVMLMIGGLAAFPGYAPAAASVTQQTSSASEAPGVSYTHWQDLPPGPLKDAFSNKGSQLINNLNIVKLQGGKPVLIRGGGFTPASLDWLVLDMGVRTVVDLRGRFSDDKTTQLVVHSPTLLKAYQERHQEDRLKNLSPDRVEAYLHTLGQAHHLTLRYIHTRAEDPALLSSLDKASPGQALAMFCQYGVNRSGTAWGAYAAHQGWSLDQAYKTFGVPKPSGNGIINQRDIQYGYRLKKTASIP